MVLDFKIIWQFFVGLLDQWQSATHLFFLYQHPAQCIHDGGVVLIEFVGFLSCRQRFGIFLQVVSQSQIIQRVSVIGILSKKFFILRNGPVCISIVVNGVPEPGVLALLGLGLAGMTFVCRRKLS